MKRVQVEWIDSISDGAWTDRDNAISRAANPDVLSCTSVGLLLVDTDDYILLATSHMRDGDLVQGILQIPRVAVREVRELRR